LHRPADSFANSQMTCWKRTVGCESLLSTFKDRRLARERADMVGEEDGAVVVFTKETRREILNQGGSRGWVVNPRSVEKCPYLVCCRRAQWDNRAENTKHRSAFLVGRITNLEKVDESENARGQARYEIGISEYAEIDLSDTWRRELRNPVAYSTL